MSHLGPRGKDLSPHPGNHSQKSGKENPNYPPAINRQLQPIENRQQQSSNQNIDRAKELDPLEKENNRLNSLLTLRNNECESLRKQLDALKYDKGDKITLLLNEIERLTAALNGANQEIFTLRERFPPGDSQEETQRTANEFRSPSYLTKPSELSERINILNAECRKLSELLDSQERENKILRQSNLALATENEGLRASLAPLQGLNEKVITLENKCHELIKENEMLTAQLNESARGSIMELNTQNKPSTDERVRGRSQGIATGDGRGQIRRNADTGNQRILELLAENDKLNKTLDILNKDHAALSDLVRQIPKLAEENEKLQKQLAQSHKENERMPSSQEIDSVKTQLQETLTKLNESDAKLQAVTNDYNKIDAALKAAIAENADLRKSLQELQRLGNIASGLGENVDKIKQENESLKRAIEAKAKETELAKSEIVLLRDTVARKDRELETQNERLKQIMHEHSRTASEVDKLKAECEMQRREIEKLNLLFSESQANASKIHSQLMQSQKEITRANEDNSQLRQVVNDANSLKPRLEEMGRIVQQLQREIERLNSIIAQKTREHANLKEKQAYLLEQATKNDQNIREIGRLEGLLNIKATECALLSGKVNELERRVEKVREMEELNATMQKDNAFMYKQMQELKRELAKRVHGSGKKGDDLARKEEELRQREAELYLREQELHRKSENVGRETFRSKSQFTDRDFDEDRKAYETQISALKEKISSLEKKIQALHQENENLSQALKRKTSELDDRQNFSDLARKAAGSPGDRMKEENIRKLQEQLEATGKSAAELMKENDQLQAKLNDATKELREWKAKYQAVEASRAREVGQLQAQLENYQHTQAGAGHKSAEIAAYEAQLKQLQQVVEDGEIQMKQLVLDNQRLTTLSVERLKNLEEWRLKFNDLDEKYKIDTGELRAQIELYKSNHYDTKQLAIRVGAERAADQNQINQLKQMNNNYREELEKVYELMNERKTEHTKLANDYEALLKAYEQAKEQLKSINKGSSEEDKLRIEALQREIYESNKAKEEYRRQAERNSLELSKKTKELIDRIHEVEDLKVKYKEALTKYQQSNSQLFEKMIPHS